MITLDVEEGDDADFVAKVQAVAVAIATRYAPHEVVVVKLDNWFGPKWLGFSGKTLGALGVWKSPPTVPPFVPARVLHQLRFQGPVFDAAPQGDALHIATSSEAALKCQLSDAAPGAAVIWFSGGTAGNGRGAVMAYVPNDDSYSAWYAGWLRKDEWRPVMLRGLSTSELRSLLDRERPDAAAETGR
jgi:hypothetical protein